MIRSPSFIDCDTHFAPMEALKRLARIHPDVFRYDDEGPDPGWIRFFANGRLEVTSRAGADIGGSGDHGRLSLETRVRDIDREDPGTIQVLGFVQNLAGTQWVPVVGADVARVLNDAVAELLADFPQRDRFIPLCTVYLPWVEEAIREVQRAAKMGFRGVFIGPILEPYGNLSLAHQGLWRFYEVLQDLDLPIIHHNTPKKTRDWSSYDWGSNVPPTLVGANHPALQKYGDLELLFGGPFTYACEMADLIFSGTLDRFPNLRFAFLEGRLSSYVPPLMDTLDHVRPRDLTYQVRRRPREYFEQFYPAATADEVSLHYTVDCWPDHNIVLGSDYPHSDASGTWPNSVRLIRANEYLSEEHKERILWKNAARLFKREVNQSQPAERRAAPGRA